MENIVIFLKILDNKYFLECTYMTRLELFGLFQQEMSLKTRNIGIIVAFVVCLLVIIGFIASQTEINDYYSKLINNVLEYHSNLTNTIFRDKELKYESNISQSLFLNGKEIPMNISNDAIEYTRVSSEIKNLFYGILTTSKKIGVRMIFRSIIKITNPEQYGITVRFIVGIEKDSSWNERIKLENDTYGDIIQLRMYENMNNGKSYQYFKYIHDNKHWLKYKFIGKYDDDTFTDFGNLYKWLSNLNVTKDVYYGYCIWRPGNMRSVTEHVYSGKPNLNMYIGGCCYGMSMDIVNYINSNESWAYPHIHRGYKYDHYIIDKKRRIQRAIAEDAQTTHWLAHDKKGYNTICFENNLYKLDYWGCQPWDKGYCDRNKAPFLKNIWLNETMHIHFVKTYKSWLFQLKYWYPNIKLLPINININTNEVIGYNNFINNKTIWDCFHKEKCPFFDK